MPRRFRIVSLLLFVLTSGILPLMGAGPWNISVRSGKPHMISGGDTLIQIDLPTTNTREDLQIFLNDRDVSDVFRLVFEGRSMGHVTGLRLGSNLLKVLSGAMQVAELALVNHPITGPVFSGPHQAPFLCQTETAGLGKPLDEDCSVNTIVAYFYKSTDPVKPEEGESVAPAAEGVPRGWRIPRGFKLLTPDTSRPDDMATTTTSEGNTVDYIVRRETGTINRAIYAIAFLHQPGTPLPDPWTRTPGWNGRLIYSFGGGCGAGYHQALPGNVLNDNFLSLGYAWATSSLNAFGNDCNDLISAETAVMVKEYFTEQFGVPIHTIGWGGSGGSMQQHLIAQNYPGVLDGIIPLLSYPDIVSIITPVVDCSLLEDAFELSEQSWADEQKTAVSGYATWGTCKRWLNSYSPGFLNPSRCNLNLPPELLYHPETNPGGARCDIYDNQINAFGRDPDTGFARSPLDNIGVQYGLVAFNSGVISAEQFLDLNERMGGFDVDGKIVPERTVADLEAVRVAYRSGRVNSGRGGLASIPIVDARSYVDPLPDIHDSFRSFAMRARLEAANGNADNQVILIFPSLGAPGRDLWGRSPFNEGLKEALRLLDRWLDNIAADTSDDSQELKVSRNRPSDLTDACWTKEGEKVVQKLTHTGKTRCNELYPIYSDPRIAAGGPLADDILKCTLKPVDPGDYSQALTEEQLARLKRIFPEGVCDYSRPGMGQQQSLETWQRY